MEHQIGNGAPVPPKPTDAWCAIGTDEDCMVKWAKRVPLADSVVPPDDALMVVLVVRPTSDESCLYARGASVTYKQGWLKHTNQGCSAMIVHAGDFASCYDALDR